MARIRTDLIKDMAEEIKGEYPEATTEMVEDYLKCGDEKLSRSEINYLLDLLHL